MTHLLFCFVVFCQRVDCVAFPLSFLSFLLFDCCVMISTLENLAPGQPLSLPCQSLVWMTIPRLIMECHPRTPSREQGCLLIRRRRCFTASGGSCSFEWQGQGCVREGATGGDLVGALLVDPPSPPRPDQCPSRPPPPPPARASVTTAWVPVNPTVCPCPLLPSQSPHYLVGHPPRWASLGASVAAHGRHGYGDVFHYHPATAIVIDSLMLQLALP